LICRAGWRDPPNIRAGMMINGQERRETIEDRILRTTPRSTFSVSTKQQHII